MALPAGTLFGPYELLGPLGSGGMGEVFRARDPRLGREVAVKILRRDVLSGAEAVRRFEQEARAAGALNHPNVLAVFDVGTHDGLPFVVTELLEGETLRTRLERGPLAPRKALDHALQIARGLAAAHEKGIVHRDLKPENIFLTRDGRAKILDFGLAKLVEDRRASMAPLTTPKEVSPATEPGMVLGTAGYMAPEQVRGEPADARSDIFALGALIYEMLTAKRAFDGPTRIAILYGILNAEPPELPNATDPLLPGLDAALRHCLEKRQEDRFQSASDLAFQLEYVGSGSPTSSARMRKLAAARRLNIARAAAFAALLLALGVGLGSGLLVDRRLGRTPQPEFHQVTFRRGAVRSARLTPDGHTVIYSANFETRAMQLYAASTQGVESRELGFSPADVYSISASGELALGLHLEPGPSSYVMMGTLARVPLAGGAPRELTSDVQFADWAGDDLAIVRQAGGKYRIELPPGHVLAETQGWFSDLRLSPRGDRLAFIDHRLYGDDRGQVAVMNRDGENRRMVSEEYTSAQGLAWNGEEIWFTASGGIGRVLRATTLQGKERVVLASPAALRLYDIARDGSVLLGRSSARAGIVGRQPDGSEHDLSWLDYSIATGLSRSAGLFSFFEAGEGGGSLGSAYVRKLDGTPAIKLGPGFAWDLSRDGRTIVQFTPAEPLRIRLVPTGVGEPRVLDLPLERISGARLLPAGDKVVVSGNLPHKGGQLFLADGASLTPFTPEGVNSVFYTVAPISPDGRRIVAQGVDGRFSIYSIDRGAQPRPLPIAETERPQGWADDGALYVHKPRELPQVVERLEIATGKRERVVEFSPADRAGIEQIGPVFVQDRRVMLYGYVRNLEELYVAQGLH